MYSLIVTCKINGVDPHAWLKDILAPIAAHPALGWTNCCSGIGRHRPQRSPPKEHDHARQQGSSRHHHTPVAADLGEDKDWLRDVVNEMEIEDASSESMASEKMASKCSLNSASKT